MVGIAEENQKLVAANQQNGSASSHVHRVNLLSLYLWMTDLIKLIGQHSQVERQTKNRKRKENNMDSMKKYLF
jgi:hypothetical protein